MWAKEGFTGIFWRSNTVTTGQGWKSARGSSVRKIRVECGKVELPVGDAGVWALPHPCCWCSITTAPCRQWSPALAAFAREVNTIPGSPNRCDVFTSYHRELSALLGADSSLKSTATRGHEQQCALSRLPVCLQPKQGFLHYIMFFSWGFLPPHTVLWGPFSSPVRGLEPCSVKALCSSIWATVKLSSPHQHRGCNPYFAGLQPSSVYTWKVNIFDY